ncbi:MAG: hypothetical protein R3331_04020 [Sulfurospirillaceae bacterium]|nr:hypothetical protein [Sulfurospirillaceae bacterium]
MNLPHLPPLLFAKEIIYRGSEDVKVACEFPYIPTLPMILEAAAQASSAFGDQQEGFLVSASDIEYVQKIEDMKIEISIKKEFDMQNMHMFSFSVENFTKGKFTIYVK